MWLSHIKEKEEEFEKEIYDICKDDLTIGNCFDVYESLNGDYILKKEVFRDDNGDENNDINKRENEKEEEIDENEIREEREEL